MRRAISVGFANSSKTSTTLCKFEKLTYTWHRKYLLEVPTILPTATFTTSKCTNTSACWKCNHKWETFNDQMNSFACPKCNTLQKILVENLPDYFKLLQHEKTYRVDESYLAKRVKLTQKKLHPDLYAQKDEEEREISQQLSAFVNKAYSTLLDPIERGHYLLKLHGLDITNDLEKQLTLDPDFLEEVMELNEKLEEIHEEAQWREFRTHNEIKQKDLRDELETAFEMKKFEEAKKILSRMKYFESLQHKMKELQSKIGVVD